VAVKISLANAGSAQNIAFTKRRKEFVVFVLFCLLLLRSSSSSAQVSLKVDKSDARDDDEFKEEKERDAPLKPFTTRAFLLGFFLKSSSFLFLISMAR
jgi:hypothetical protein